MADKLSIFISWSGDLSREIGQEVQRLLPAIFDGVDPWLSSHSIEAGARWGSEIAKRLDETFFAIIVVTADNQHAEWLNFEAGAVSKQFGDVAESFVAPLLVGLSKADVTGPLAQFQMNDLDREGFEKIVETIAGRRGVQPEIARRRLANEWEGFSDRVGGVIARRSKTKPAKPRDADDILAEVLDLVRRLSIKLDRHIDASTISIDSIRAPVLAGSLKVGEAAIGSGQEFQLLSDLDKARTFQVHDQHGADQVPKGREVRRNPQGAAEQPPRAE